MEKWTEDLLKLQDVDIRIKRMKVRLSMLPKEKATFEEERKKAETNFKMAGEKSKKTELSIKQVESAIAQHNDEIKRLQNQSIMVKKNNEYQALMGEIGNIKSKIGDLETKEIELLDELQNYRVELKKYEKDFVAKSGSIQEGIKELEQLSAELNEEITALTAGRKDFEKFITADLLRIYTRLLQSNGDALVRISGGICGNCHLKLTPQTLNQVKKGAVTICDNCSHLLYLEN